METPSDVADLVARLEVQTALVDRNLTAPARWRGSAPPAFAACYDALVSCLATTGARASWPELRAAAGAAWPVTPHLDLDALVDESGSAAVSPFLGAARAAMAVYGATRSPLLSRLTLSRVLLGVGMRSTLTASLGDHAVPRDDSDVAAVLAAMVRRSDAAARLRRRDDELRHALLELGVASSHHDAAISAFDGQTTDDEAAGGLAGTLDELLSVSAPWPLLRQAWGEVGERAGWQWRRLHVEEADDRRRQRIRPAAPAAARPVAGDAVPDVCPPRPGAPAASVVIPAYRSASTIRAVLDGLAAQDIGEPFEVIVVASGGDATADIVRRAHPEVRIFATDGRLAPGAGRNVGVAASGAPVVAFVAADCVPRPDWLRRRVEAHRAGHALVAGYIDAAEPSTTAGWAQYFAKFWGMLRLEGTCRDGRGPLFHLSYRRDLLAEPFDERAIAGEDTAYNHALVEAGHRVHFDSAIRVLHLNQRRWAEVVAGQREQGAATGAVCAGHGLGTYYVPSVRGGPWTPLLQGGRAVREVARVRPRLLPRILLCLPMLVAAISVRRRAFRRTFRGRAQPPAPGPPGDIRAIAPMAMRPPLVSAIVPAYNEEAVIADCLDSLLAQSLDELEIIVADDGSTDATASVAASRGVRVLHLPHGGPARAKNAAAAAATGAVLAFIDADLSLDPKCLERLCAPVLQGTALGTFTKDISVSNPDDPWAACWTLNRRADPGQHFPPGMPDRWANFRAVSRLTFVAAGGYDDVGYGEDMTLSPKLGGALADAVPGAAMAHHHPDSLREVWGNARWVGRGVAVRQVPGVARRYAPWRSLRRGIRGARRLGLARFLLFAVVYDFGVLSAYAQARVGWGTHAK
ncbi:MAG TPA: glycosyltransferase [Acidimicrobiales bacterium]|nr:glycosyltransferase [Acidimicrobiales bacterium]